MASARVLSVGQCGYDNGQISRYLQTEFSAHVRSADTFDEAVTELRAQPYDLVLVNRLFDADGSLGVDLIRILKSQPDLAVLPVMLVSNLPNAQSEAVAAGAIPGFGKSALRDPSTRESLGSILGSLA